MDLSVLVGVRSNGNSRYFLFFIENIGAKQVGFMAYKTTSYRYRKVEET